MLERQEIYQEKKYIFIPNHQKWIDSWLAYNAIQKLQLAKTVRPMMARSLTRSPLGKAFKLMGGFETNLDTAEKYLNQGHSILIYPQGRPSQITGIRETKPGARELSLRSGVPLFPLLIETPPKLNSKEIFLKKNSIVVKTGQPFFPRVDEDVMERVWDLKNNFNNLIELQTGPRIMPALTRPPFINAKRIFLEKSA